MDVIDYDFELRAHNERLRAAVAVEPGQRVLDIGCGAGQTTREAARAAAPGHVLGIDLSVPLLERARTLAAAERLDNVTFEHGDAQVYPFARGHFDLAISRFGAMFFSDPPAAFGNIARALRPRARLVLLVWQSRPRNEWAMAIESALRGPMPATARSPSATAPSPRASSNARASTPSSSPTSANPSSTGATPTPRWSSWAASSARAKRSTA